MFQISYPSSTAYTAEYEIWITVVYVSMCNDDPKYYACIIDKIRESNEPVIQSSDNNMEHAHY